MRALRETQRHLDPRVRTLALTGVGLLEATPLYLPQVDRNSGLECEIEPGDNHIRLDVKKLPRQMKEGLAH